MIPRDTKNVEKKVVGSHIWGGGAAKPILGAPSHAQQQKCDHQGRLEGHHKNVAKEKRTRPTRGTFEQSLLPSLALKAFDGTVIWKVEVENFGCYLWSA